MFDGEGVLLEFYDPFSSATFWHFTRLEPVELEVRSESDQFRYSVIHLKFDQIRIDPFVSPD